MCSSSTMYTHCFAFTFAALSVSVFVARILAAPGPDCTRRANGVDTSTRTARCFLPGNQPLVFPNDNRRTCFRTCITETVFPPTVDCCANFSVVNNQRIRILAPRGNRRQNFYNVRIIHSPNFLREDENARFYRGSTICRYNVQCRPGQILHYYISQHTLQGPEVDPPDTTTPMCVDFLGIDRTAYNVPDLKRTCGDLVSIEDDRSDFNGARLSVEFRANRRLENLGFFMVVTCVNPEFYDLDGCTPAQPARPDVSRRKKRNTKTEMSEMFKIRKKRFRFRVPCIKVPTDAAVSYENSTVRVVRGTVSLYRFPGIRVFHVFNRAERFQAFYGSAGGRVFPGFGELQIGDGSAYFIQQGVKTQFRLSPLEQDVLGQLWTEVLSNSSILASEDFSVDDPLDTAPPGGQNPTPTLYPGRGKRYQEGNTSGRRDRQKRQQAIDFERLIEDNMGNCNGVLRATACAIRELVLNQTCEVPSSG